MGCEEDQTDVLWGDSDVEIDSGLPRRFAAAPAAGAGWSADLRGLAHLLFPFEAGSRLGPAEVLRDLGTAGTAGELDRPGACVDGALMTHQRVTPGHGQISADFLRLAMVQKQEIP